MRKLWLIPLTILVLSLLAACGGAAPETEKAEPVAVEEAAPVAEEAAPAPAEEEAAMEEEAAPAEEEAGIEASGDGTITIGVSMLFDDAWLTTLREAMRAYAETQKGVALVMVDSKENVGIQLGQVENFVTQGVDAIVLIPAKTE
jgi:inositol transport system substrate-binding protein